MGCKAMVNVSKSRLILGLVKIDWVMGSYESLRKLLLLKEPLTLRMKIDGKFLRGISLT